MNCKISNKLAEDILNILSFVYVIFQGCQVVGVDLSKNNLLKAKSFLTEESSTLKVEFHEQNFFNLTEDLLNRKYTHVWAQVIC